VTTSKSTKFPKHYASRFSAYRLLNQAIPDIAATTILFDLINFDVMQEYNSTTLNNFQPKRAGYYYLHASAGLTDLNIGDLFDLYILQNPATYLAITEIQANSLNEDMFLSCDCIAYLTPLDTVQIQVYHNFGANRWLQGNGCVTSFQGFRIG